MEAEDIQKGERFRDENNGDVVSSDSFLLDAGSSRKLVGLRTRSCRIGHREL